MSPLALKAVINGISSDRIATYRAVTRDDLRALHLYQWNIACSSALYGPLQALEVRLRNALHQAAVAHFHQDNWWDHPSLKLTDIHQRMLMDAYRNTRRAGYTPTASRIVSQLPFGFWVGLLGKGVNYEMTLWRPALRHAFPNYQGTRAAMHESLDKMRTIRNRIAHHEPVFQRHLAADITTAVRIINHMCPDTAAWVSARSRFWTILKSRPTSNSSVGVKF